MAAPTKVPARASEPTALARMADVNSLAPVVEMSSTAAAQMARTNVEARFQMALHRPRDWERVRSTIMEACKRPRFAEEARYKVPRGGEDIEGLSIRFAEEAARALGNLMVEARVSFDDAERRTVAVWVTDLEANITWPMDVVVEKTVERRKVFESHDVVGERVNSHGTRLFIVRATDDEVFTKQNQLVAKAARNGILRFIPADLQEDALAEVVKTLTGAARDKATLERLEKAFAVLGVKREDLEGLLGHKLEEITAEEYATLRAAGAALKEGTTSWQQIKQEYRPPMETQRRQRKAGPAHVKQGDVGYGGETAPAAKPAAPAKTKEQIRQETAEHGYPPEDTAPLPHQTQNGAPANAEGAPAAPEPAGATGGQPEPAEAPTASQSAEGSGYVPVPAEGPQPEVVDPDAEWVCGQCGVDTGGEVCENCGAPKGAGDAAE